ncbi:hypothetical protein [Streptomyces sp. NPDC057623]|uniref:hypothetical protein n=1 Tax=Streptomyces sp. NPDC057623 TaxID=3346187 RepID=UPI0036BF69F8
MAASRYRPPTARDIAEDDWHTDNARGRRHCPVHPSQQMIPMLAGPDVDMCPLPHGEDEPTS